MIILRFKSLSTEFYVNMGHPFSPEYFNTLSGLSEIIL